MALHGGHRLADLHRARGGLACHRIRPAPRAGHPQPRLCRGLADHPFVHDYPTLLALSVVHGLLLGTFVPATLMIVFRNLPIRWWLPAISIYSIRVGFALDTSSSLVGFYVDHLGWQWLYWQSVVI